MRAADGMGWEKLNAGRRSPTMALVAHGGPPLRCLGAGGCANSPGAVSVVVPGTYANSDSEAQGWKAG